MYHIGSSAPELLEKHKSIKNKSPSYGGGKEIHNVLHAFLAVHLTSDSSWARGSLLGQEEAGCSWATISAGLFPDSYFSNTALGRMFPPREAQAVPGSPVGTCWSLSSTAFCPFAVPRRWRRALSHRRPQPWPPALARRGHLRGAEVNTAEETSLTPGRC